MRLFVCHIRTNTETNVFFSYVTDLCLGLSPFVQIIQRQKESMCRKEENKARSIFFHHMPSKERGNLYPRTKFKCPSQRATGNETAHETEREVWGFFLNWKNVENVVLLLWHHLVFRSVEYQQLLWRKQKFYHFWKSGPLPCGEEPCELPFLSFLCCIPSSIYLGNPLPPPTMLKNTILFYRFKKIIVFFFPKKVRLGKHRPLFKIGQLNQIDPIRMFLFSYF